LTANATTPPLQYGLHVVYFFAGDGSEATSIARASSPTIGSVGAYVFAYLPPITTAHISAISSNHHDVVITFDAISANTYRLERETNLTGANWQSISGLGDFTAGSTSSAQFTDLNAISLGEAFYRVRLLP